MGQLIARDEPRPVYSKNPRVNNYTCGDVIGLRYSDQTLDAAEVTHNRPLMYRQPGRDPFRGRKQTRGPARFRVAHTDVHAGI